MKGLRHLAAGAGDNCDLSNANVNAIKSVKAMPEV
jgi:hypothetical protein